MLIAHTGQLSDSLHEHEQILDAVGSGSADDAAKTMQVHLEQTEVKLTELLQPAPAPAQSQS